MALSSRLHAGSTGEWLEIKREISSHTLLELLLFQMGDSRQEMKEKIAKEKKVIPDPIEAKENGLSDSYPLCCR